MNNIPNKYQQLTSNIYTNLRLDLDKKSHLTF